MLRNLARNFGTQHTIAVAYAPSSNGSVERLRLSVLAVMRRICSVNRRAYAEWGTCLNAAQGALNTTMSKRLKGSSPAQVMTTSIDHDATLSILMEEDADPRVVAINDTPDTLFREMHQSMESLHKGLLEEMDERRQRAWKGTIARPT